MPIIIKYNPISLVENIFNFSLFINMYAPLIKVSNNTITHQLPTKNIEKPLNISPTIPNLPKPIIDMSINNIPFSSGL